MSLKESLRMVLAIAEEHATPEQQSALAEAKEFCHPVLQGWFSSEMYTQQILQDTAWPVKPPPLSPEARKEFVASVNALLKQIATS